MRLDQSTHHFYQKQFLKSLLLLFQLLNSRILAAWRLQKSKDRNYIGNSYSSKMASVEKKHKGGKRRLFRSSRINLDLSSVTEKQANYKSRLQLPNQFPSEYIQKDKP